MFNSLNVCIYRINLWLLIILRKSRRRRKIHWFITWRNVHKKCIGIVQKGLRLLWKSWRVKFWEGRILRIRIKMIKMLYLIRRFRLLLILASAVISALVIGALSGVSLWSFWDWPTSSTSLLLTLLEKWSWLVFKASWICFMEVVFRVRLKGGRVSTSDGINLQDYLSFLTGLS